MSAVGPHVGDCPDDGRCHHQCPESSCFRVRFCGPLSGVYENDEWPANVVSEHGVEPREERIADLEQAVMDLSELVRHLGQTLSWTSAGRGLNDPPRFIHECQKRLKNLHSKLEARRG